MDSLTSINHLSCQRKDEVILVPQAVLKKFPRKWTVSINRQMRKRKRVRDLNDAKIHVQKQSQKEDTVKPVLPNLVPPKEDAFVGAVSPYIQIEEFYEKNTFENQRDFAGNILRKIQDSEGKISQILALAPTQSGKTGTMIACVHKFVNEARIMQWNHVFVYTPHSSKDWVNQTKGRFPGCLQKNIHHRNHTDVLMRKIKSLLDRNEKNILLIIDEAHIACKYNQTLFHMYKTLGLYDRNVLYENNIKILMFTATPEGLKGAMERDDLPWKKHTEVVHMNVPEQYLSIDDFRKKGIVHPMRDLCGYNKDTQVIHHSAYVNILQMMEHVDPKTPKYHIIRTLNGKNHIRTIHNFITLFFDTNQVSQKYKEKISPVFVEILGSLVNLSFPRA